MRNPAYMVGGEPPETFVPTSNDSMADAIREHTKALLELAQAIREHAYLTAPEVEDEEDAPAQFYMDGTPVQ